MGEINKLCQEAYENAKSKGFYDKPIEMGTRIALIHSELSEALEADRKGKYVYFCDVKKIIPNSERGGDHQFKEFYKSCIKGTFEEEITDVAIRLFDLCGYLNIDLEAHIKAKMRYNSLREHLHGKKY